MKNQRRTCGLTVTSWRQLVCLALGTIAALSVYAGTTTYTYDANGRLSSVAAPNGQDLSIATITYDPGDNRTSIVYGYQDHTPPNPPTSLTATAEAWNWIQLNWTPSLDVGGGPVSFYRVYRGGNLIASPSAPPYNDQSLQGNTPYSYTVSAVDPSNNESTTQAGPASATTPPPPDTTAPSVPSNLQGVAVSGTQINLTWTGSTDTGGSGLAGYQIFRNGGTFPIGTSTVASYSDTPVSPAATYTYTVLAYDNAGNKSALSNQVLVTTPDTIAPGAPGNPTFSAITNTSATASWTAASDNVGVTQYRYSLTGGSSWTTIGNTLSVGLTGLMQSTQYTLLVEAGDAAGNWGAAGSGAFTTTGPITDNLNFVPGSNQTGVYPNLVITEGYLQGGMGTLSPNTTSNGHVIYQFLGTALESDGSTTISLEIFGFTSDPGAAWLTSISVAGTGVTLTGASATYYSYSSGIAYWSWPGWAAASGSGVLTIVHY